jgi:queuine tRNA-ribosyltransferase
MPEGPARFELIAECRHTGARRGRIVTRHGVVETPAFMPVGTQGTVKAVGAEDLQSLGYQMVLSNTYHLSLRPGADLIERLGGLGEFMGWPGATLTDSGGYQVMSLEKTRRMSEEGVHFKSHVDGSPHFLSPEGAIRLQAQFGVDVSMALDECPPYPCSREAAIEAMERTHRWAARCLSAREPQQAVFGIIQGGIHEDLRRRSVETITSMPFDGFAIGGVSVGEPTELQRPVVANCAPLLPANKVRYLMGVGHPGDIIHAVACGIDLFDCVLPTRMARHHTVYTLRGRINILRREWAEATEPYDPDSVFPAVARYTPAYVRHLFKVNEPLGPRITTLHNLAFYARLMEDIRNAIEGDSWSRLVRKYEAI